MCKAVKPIMVHLIYATAMLNKGLGDYLRCYWCEKGHVVEMVPMQMSFNILSASKLLKKLIMYDKLFASAP
jgi:hypothetical protein